MTKKQYEDEVERLAPSLRRIAYSIVRNEHDAQDAVQQALLAVWARRECVEFARLKPYLTRAVMNACRDIQRARQKATAGGTASAVAAALHGGVQAG